jgi:hypothetical protein
MAAESSYRRWRLLSGGLAVPGHDIGRHPAAFLDVDALASGPGADRRGVRGGRAPAAAGSPAGAADLAGVRDERLQGVAQCLAVRRAQVDFIVGAVQGEADGPLGLAAVDVIDVEGLDFLGYAVAPFPGSNVAGNRRWPV